MKFIKNEKVIEIMQNTLNFVDARLIDHGKRVAFLVYKMLEFQNKYTQRELRDICILGMLHDIGAYKTEEINKMAEFETTDVWDHSVYGYLFLKYFSPLKELAPVIFFHHADCREAEYLPPDCRELAQIIYLCDRVDVYLLTGNNPNNFRSYIEGFRDIQFPSALIDRFFALNIELNSLGESIRNDVSFRRTLYDTPLTKAEAESYIRMTIFSIESRSSQTVIHSIATVCAAAALARLSGLTGDDAEQITTAALLHDIGKTGVPIGILESPSRLTETEMSTMKSHVDMTEKIIAGSVAEEIKQIAVRHHEKLNGSGYPKGLSSSDLSLKERILGVADLLSALCQARSYKDAWPKEKIIGIVHDMSAQGLIDSKTAALAVGHFDAIIEELSKASQPVLEIYQIVKSEYAQLKSKLKNADFKGLNIC